MVQQRPAYDITATALQISTSNAMQLGHWQGAVCNKDRAIAKA